MSVLGLKSRTESMRGIRGGIRRRRFLQRRRGAAVAGLPMLNFGRFRVFADSPHNVFRARGQARRALARDRHARRRSRSTSRPKPTRHPLTRSRKPPMFRAQRHHRLPQLHRHRRAERRRGDADLPRRVAGLRGAQLRTCSRSSARRRTSTAPRRQASSPSSWACRTPSTSAKPTDVKTFYQLGQRCAQLTYNSQNLLGSRQHRSRRRRRQRLRRGDHQGDERGRHAGRRLALRRPHDARRDRALAEADRDHAFELPRAQRPSAPQDRRGDPASSRRRAASWASPACASSCATGEPTTIEHIVDHIDHVVKLVGIEHVGIGSDSDLNGYDDMPPDQRKELMAVVQVELRASATSSTPTASTIRSKIFDLTEALIRRGYCDDEHRGRAGRQFPAAAGHRLGPGAGHDNRGELHMNMHRGRNALHGRWRRGTDCSPRPRPAPQTATATSLGEVDRDRAEAHRGARRHPDVGLRRRRRDARAAADRQLPGPRRRWSRASASIPTRPASPRITLRGINTGGVASTVGIYVNDVPFGSSSGLANAAILSGDFDTFDMARSRCCADPQGTLYGASSLGGVIKYVANAPSTDGFEGRLQGSVEDVAGGGPGLCASPACVNIPDGRQLCRACQRLLPLRRRLHRLDRQQPDSRAAGSRASTSSTGRWSRAISTASRPSADAFRPCSRRRRRSRST